MDSANHLHGFKITTERLHLLPFQVTDAPFMRELANSPSWLLYIGDRQVYTDESAAAYIERTALKSYAENGFGMYKTVETATGKTIGSCGFVKREGMEDIEIGGAFLPGYEAKGYGLEMATALIPYAKNVLGLKKILAVTDVRNAPSIRLIEKGGFVFVRIQQNPGDAEVRVYEMVL